MTPIEQLEHIIPAISQVADRIWFSQLESPTPCADLDVHGVIDHMIVGASTFAPMFRGEEPSAVVAPVVYGWVPAKELASALRDVLDAVQSPGAMDRMMQSPFGEVTGDTFARFVAFDGLVHGWDLARATRQTFAPDAEVVEAVAAFVQQAIRPEMRDGQTFKEPTDPGTDAGPLERLVAFSGRTV